MLFNSYQFLFQFLPVVFVGFFVLAKLSHRLAAFWLALASLFFYGYWDQKYVALLLVSITFNYLFGFALAKADPARRAYKNRVLFIAVSFNLGLLGYYKYANFFIETLDALTGTEFAIREIILPLGISFFTFTQIAFLVDSHRGIAKEYSFIHYILFVTYFPHLIAGPILHHKQMMPQFSDPKTYLLSAESISLGLVFFSIGLGKKILLADNFALIATPIFTLVETGQPIGFQTAWVGSLAYTLQLYFDFSGYCDMAIGASLFFGIQLPLNFNSPYKATSIIEFWRRWHMTLSQFLRDYLYIPLGGNRLGTKRRHLNLMLTMVLGGLWHGANWTFVIWGALHGMFLMVNHAWRHLQKQRKWDLPRSLSAIQTGSAITLTFVCVTCAWVFFRASSPTAALVILTGMFSGPTIENMYDGKILFVCLGLAMVLFLPNTQQIAGFLSSSRQKSIVYLASAFLALVTFLSLLNLHQPSEFIYFNF